jgi:hypothetical protein
VLSGVTSGGEYDTSKMDRFLKPWTLLLAPKCLSVLNFISTPLWRSVVQPDHDNLPAIELMTGIDDDQLSRTIQQLVLFIHAYICYILI